MMKVLKFTTKISDKGIIQVPLNKTLYNQEVEVTIRPKLEMGKSGAKKATDFVHKWAGFLKDPNIDGDKYNYLTDKYQ